MRLYCRRWVSGKTLRRVLRGEVCLCPAGVVVTFMPDRSLKGGSMSIVRSTRREFLKGSMALGAGIVTTGSLGEVLLAAQAGGSKMKLGLVTYLWGQYWDLPTVIANCEKTGVLGVELRTEHAHKVEANLTDAQRRDVKKRFADSKVTLVSLGTNFAFHYPEEDMLRKDIEGAKQ